MKSNYYIIRLIIFIVILIIYIVILIIIILKMTSPATKSSIYTKKGDTGLSSIYTGETFNKYDIVFEAVGGLDELSAAIGCIAQYDKVPMLGNIQCRLLDIGSYLTTSQASINDRKIQRTAISLDSSVSALESEIDAIDSKLPKLTNFILPKGQIHLSRTVCRRAERRVVELIMSVNKSADNSAGNSNELTNEQMQILKYINRLSDYLFVLARSFEIEEVKYKKE